MRINPKVNYDLISETLRELALDQAMLIVGSYSTILVRLNAKRISHGYDPITLQALRTSSFRKAIADLGGLVVSGRGPVVIPARYLREEGSDTDQSNPGGVPSIDPAQSPGAGHAEAGVAGEGTSLGS